MIIRLNGASTGMHAYIFKGTHKDARAMNGQFLESMAWTPSTFIIII